MSAVSASVSGAGTTTGRGAVKQALLVGLPTVGLGALAGSLAVGGNGSTIVALVTVFLGVAVWMRPQIGPLVLLSTALLIEQFNIPLTMGSQSVSIPLTESIPVFQGLGSLHLQPADLLPVAIFVIYLIRSAGTERRWWPRTQLSLAVAAVFAAMLVAEINGIVHHGNQRWSFFECRPFVYFAAAYLLTSVMIRTRSAVRALLWAIVAANLVKSVQAVYVWTQTSTWKPKPEDLVSHEVAVFFTLYFVVVAALWVFNLPSRLRKVGTWGVPLVVFANMVNDRRAAWLLLGGALMVLIATGYRVVPERRRVLRRVIIVTLVGSVVYLPAYWNHTDGTLGAPADAVRSAFSPSARDALSNEYRVDEDANLQFNIKQNGLLGSGFGQLIDYALPMPGLVTAGDAGITYVPHNSVLFLMMDMGFFGAAAFWSMLGAGIIAGCRLARCPDRLLAAVGAIGAAMVVAWALEGAVDMGFTFVRIAMVMGCLLGLIEAGRHIHVQSDREATRRRRRMPELQALAAVSQKNPPRQAVPCLTMPAAMEQN